MNVLSIGNSFSQDATRYLHQIARADGITLTTVNLYIGGCPLSRHYRNMLSEERAYGLECNGSLTGFSVSLKEALLNRDWDYITLQQVSHQSPYYETYQPYLSEIYAYVKKYCPKAKVVIHETWAYEEGSKRLTEELGYTKRKEMYEDLHNAYKKAAADINADLFIPCGTLFEKLFDKGIEKLHRDTFHGSLGTGRYALALLWYKKLTNRSVLNNTFSDFDAEVPEEEVKIVKETVENLTCTDNGKIL